MPGKSGKGAICLVEFLNIVHEVEGLTQTPRTRRCITTLPSRRGAGVCVHTITETALAGLNAKQWCSSLAVICPWWYGKLDWKRSLPGSALCSYTQNHAPQILTEVLWQEKVYRLIQHSKSTSNNALRASDHFFQCKVLTLLLGLNEYVGKCLFLQRNLQASSCFVFFFFFVESLKIPCCCSCTLKLVCGC